MFALFVRKTIDKNTFCYIIMNEQKFEKEYVMISTLHIKNVGIIDDLSIDLNNGLNILTGETGAGKTLIIDSLGIISGERFSKEMIRNGEDFSYVEACLFLPNHKNSIDGNIIVSREIYSNGRNMCKINGRMVTVNELKEFMQNILDIHGQHDNQYLLNSATHIQYLDSFANGNITKYKEDYIVLYNEYLKIKQELKNNFGDEKEKQRKLDLLKYQFNEIDKANLKPEEDIELENKREVILNSEKINQNLSIADMEISEKAIDSINNAIRALEKIETIDDKYSKQLNIIKSIYYDIQEIGRDVTNLREESYFDEEQRQEIETRLDIIFSLKRKYGNTIEEILNYKDEIEQEITRIENIEEVNNQLKIKLQNTKNKMTDLANKMIQIRKEYSVKLENEVNNEFIDLEMNNARLHIKIETNQIGNFNKDGLDKVEFLIQTNIGEEAKPLIKIASGGEISRIMLAIKNVLSNVDIIPVLIFDEIDTGISGIAAKSVGEKLKLISKKHQVLCVTHLASIAAKGDYNYYISKNVINNKTVTNVKQLNEDETIKEIARIASGEITEISLKHAKELRK